MLKTVLLKRKLIEFSISSRLYQTGNAGVFGYKPGTHKEWRENFARDVELDHKARAERSKLFRFIETFRNNGHKFADVNPLIKPQAPELDPKLFGLEEGVPLNLDGLMSLTTSINDANQLKEELEKLYCGDIAAQFDAVECEKEREWLWRRFEALILKDVIDDQMKCRLAIEMGKSQNFDHFLASKFPSVKRYGGEGCEAMMGFFMELIGQSSKCGVKEYVIGMPHRGRLCLMTGLLSYPPVVMFRKMKGMPEFPPDQSGAGDVLSHLTSSIDVATYEENESVHVTMLPNPSHLEIVNPVACGKTRARYLSGSLADYGEEGNMIGDEVVCIQVHGDAAMVAQGVNQELLQLSRLPHFDIGGSIHFVVNNQLGFTTPQERGRSSKFCTDISKQIGCPVIRVNGDHPEAVLKSARLALDYQRKFRKDIFVDMICYRRHGHNELDDPSFTNPKLYMAISDTRTIPDSYSDMLKTQNVLTAADYDSAIKEHDTVLRQNYDAIEKYEPEQMNLKGNWSKFEEAKREINDWDTGISTDLLKYIGAKSTKVPEGFNLHPRVKSQVLNKRNQALETAGKTIDWGFGETLAIGSLLYQGRSCVIYLSFQSRFYFINDFFKYDTGLNHKGFNVRLCGQDVGRATFSHRHAMLVDQLKNEIHIPLNDLRNSAGKPGYLEIANSPLSEEAVLAFEYGMSVESPNNMFIWEAQFGDFFNGAQIVIDTYISSGESKWGLQSGLILLLPHGFDGAGPDHSSCRMERWLQMSDSKEAETDGEDVNWQIVNPTNPAQYFHLLRRQMIRPFRKPLIVFAPKKILKMSEARSDIKELQPGTSFKRVLVSSTSPSPKEVETVVFLTGKHWYSLHDFAVAQNINNVSFVRLEELVPFPTKDLQSVVKQFSNAKRFVWSQEEGRNMGAWQFIYPRFKNLVGLDLEYVGRPELCQPDVGVGAVYQKQANEVIEKVFH